MESLEWTRVTRKNIRVPITARLANGGPTSIGGVEIALLPQRSTPDADTVWATATYLDGIATVLVAGPDVDPGGGLLLPEGGADIYGRVIDNPEIDVAFVGRIDLVR